jgi:hypothetical protein
VTNLLDAGPGSLRDAIAGTPSGGTVDFQPGLSGTITLTSGELAIAKDLTLSGPGADVLTVSGNQASRVFDIAAPSTVSISGLSIADGVIRAAFIGGGGLLNSGTLTVTGCNVSGNSAYGNPGPLSTLGGGIANSGTLTITDSTVSGNCAANSGEVGGGWAGGVYSAGTLTVTGSVLSGNSANANAGGILNGGTLAITHSVVSGNSTPGNGGGIDNQPGGNGTATITNSVVSGNSATTADAGVGGGIITFGTSEGSLTVTGCTVGGNYAGVQGGGIADLGAQVTVTNSTVSGNSTPGNGGGIDNEADATLTVTSSTIGGNTGGSGGGIYLKDQTAMATIRNTILAGNTAASSPDVRGPLNSRGYNLIGDGTGGSGFADTDLVGTAANPIDPLLGPLQDNGGPTPTMALLPGSPALNAGTAGGAPDTDQRGVPRGTVVSIGAYQATATQLVLSGLPDSADAGTPLTVTVTAEDPFGQTAVGYRGTVTFTSGDGGASVPDDYAFTADDAGSHTFTDGVTFSQAGDQTLTASDLGDPVLTATATVTVQGQEVSVAYFDITAADPVTAGQAFQLTVTARDADGHVVTGYRGTIGLYSLFGEDDLRESYTFTADDAGSRTFTVTLYDPGIVVTDNDALALGFASVCVNPPG